MVIDGVGLISNTILTNYHETAITEGKRGKEVIGEGRDWGEGIEGSEGCEGGFVGVGRVAGTGLCLG